MKEVKKRNKYLYKKVQKPDPVYSNDPDSSEYTEASNPKWFEELPKGPTEFSESEESEILILRNEAEIVLKKEEDFYSKKSGREKQGDKSWLRTVMSKGTAGDKVAAYVLTIQDSPVYNLPALRNLVNSVKVSKKKECLSVMDTLTELFLSDLLRPDTKLLTFDQQPLSLLNQITSGNAISRRKYLCHWFFEDQLKVLYSHFVNALDVVSKDTVDAYREKAVTAMYKLLAGNPEQEAVLLKNLVNKLGDPNQKVVSKVIYSLTQLLRVHPVMKQVVAGEIEKFLFRPNVGSRAQYYAICFLSQYLFSSEDTELAENIISIYFSFFKSNIKRGDIDSRMMAALLMGVNRAYPFARMEQNQLNEHIDTMYKLVHVCSFNISLQTLCLLYQIVGHSTDRFYSALYRKLLDPHLFTSAHQAMFVNLVYKALRNDTNIDRVKVFIKRLLQLCLNGPSQLGCALLFLVSELISKQSQLWALTIQQQAVYKGDDNNDDEEEYYKDAPLEAEDNGKESYNDTVEDVEEEKPDVKPKPGWFHCQNTCTKNKAQVFDWRLRNPAHAGGEYTAYEELTSLTTHFHPSVALFAKNILNKQPVKYTGDPLQDFTLVRFLERFVFKNPKQNAGVEVGGPDPTLAQRKRYVATGARALPLTSTHFIHQPESAVPVDELFLYRYLQKRKPTIKTKEDEDSDVESVGSDEFNEMLDNMVGKVKEDLDFADDVGDKLRSKTKSKRPQKDEGSSSEEDMSDEDNADIDEEDEDLTDLEDDDEAGSEDEAIDFGDDGEDFDGEIDLNNLGSEDEDEPLKTKQLQNKKNKRSSSGIHSMFAPAEKFAEMLEAAGASRLKLGTAQDMSNKDNAALKQLEWESKRNQQWTSGSKRKNFSKAHGKPSFNKAKRKKY